MKPIFVRKLWMPLALAGVASLLALPSSAAGPKLKVDGGNPGCSDLTGTPYCTIQAAINAAAPGTTIEVKKATYAEDLSITTDGLSLKGEPKATIAGVALTPAASFPFAAPNIDIRANGVSITGFTIKSPAGGAASYSSGVLVTGTNIKLDHNTFVTPGGTPGSVGIQTWVVPPSGPTDISGLNIDHNKFTGSAGAGFGYEAIFINPQGSPVDPGNPVKIQHNDFSGRMYRAVGVQRDFVVVDHNKLQTDLSPVQTTADFGRVPIGIAISGALPPTLDLVVRNNKEGDKGAAVFAIGIRTNGGGGAVLQNEVKGAQDNGIVVGPGASGWFFGHNKVEKTTSGDGYLVNGGGNTFNDEHSDKNSGYGFKDNTVGGGTAGTNNTYAKDRCNGNGLGKSSPAGLCN